MLSGYNCSFFNEITMVIVCVRLYWMHGEVHVVIKSSMLKQFDEGSYLLAQAVSYRLFFKTKNCKQSAHGHI